MIARTRTPLASGTWTGSTGGVCPECKASSETRAKPLILAWEAGSALVGHFVWPGLSEVVATERVFLALESNLGGFERGPIQMVDEPGYPRRGQPRMRLPYEGPRLYELWTTAWVNADLERSTLRLERALRPVWNRILEARRCRTVGEHVRPKDGLVRTRTGRSPHAGIYIPHADLGGADILRVVETPAWVFCTDAVRDLVHEQAFTNVDFFEMERRVA